MICYRSLSSLASRSFREQPTDIFRDIFTGSHKVTYGISIIVLCHWSQTTFRLSRERCTVYLGKFSELTSFLHIYIQPSHHQIVVLPPVSIPFISLEKSGFLFFSFFVTGDSLVGGWNSSMLFQFVTLF